MYTIVKKLTNLSKKLVSFHKNERGNAFVEVALIIIFLVLSVAPYLTSLGTTTGSKVQELTAKVGQVGTP